MGAFGIAASYPPANGVAAARLMAAGAKVTADFLPQCRVPPLSSVKRLAAVAGIRIARIAARARHSSAATWARVRALPGSLRIVYPDRGTFGRRLVDAATVRSAKVCLSSWIICQPRHRLDAGAARVNHRGIVVDDDGHGQGLGRPFFKKPKHMIHHESSAEV